MTTLAHPKRNRKPRPKPERSATLGTTTSGKTILWLSQDGVLRAYVLTPLPSDFGTAYRLGKADNGDGHSEEYDVLLHGRETSCTCPGHSYRNKCKHVDALEALIASGKLPATKQEQPHHFEDGEPIFEEEQIAAMAAASGVQEPWCSHCNDKPGVYCSHCSL